MAATLLTAEEARVLAALVEKSITTPQYYPLSVNALMMAANQKNSRHPQMTLSEGEVGAALNRLEQDKFVSRDPLSARVTKWRHAFHHQLLLNTPQMAVLATLILRGPQTPAELRANAAALNGPADADGVMAALQDLMERASPMVVLLPRAAGQSAARYAHTLCGAPAVEPAAPAETPAPKAERIAQLEARIEALEARIAELEARNPPPALA